MVEGSRPRSVTNGGMSMEDMYVAYNGTTRDYYLTQFEIIKSRDFAERLVRVDGAHAAIRSSIRARRKSRGMRTSSACRPGSRRDPRREGAGASDRDLEEGVVSARHGAHLPAAGTQHAAGEGELRCARSGARGARAEHARHDLHRRRPRIARRNRAAFGGFPLAAGGGPEDQGPANRSARCRNTASARKSSMAKGVSMAGASRQLEDLTTSLVEARRKRADLEALYKQVNAASQGKSAESLENLPIVLKHPAVQRSKEIESEAERRLSDASKRYGPEHPRLVAAQADYKIAQENLKTPDQRGHRLGVEGLRARGGQRDVDRARARALEGRHPGATTARSSSCSRSSARWPPTASCTTSFVQRSRKPTRRRHAVARSRASSTRRGRRRRRTGRTSG